MLGFQCVNFGGHKPSDYSTSFYMLGIVVFSMATLLHISSCLLDLLPGQLFHNHLKCKVIWFGFSCLPTSLNLFLFLAFLQDIHTQYSGLLTLLWPFYIIFSFLHLPFHHSIFIESLLYARSYSGNIEMHNGPCLYVSWSGVEWMNQKNVNVNWRVSWKK